MKKAFLSYIDDERPVATQLHTALMNDFRGLELFLSSNIDSVAAGDDWLRAIELAILDSVLFLVLCSPESIRRQWIYFEAGAAWIREVKIVPLCHSGLKPRDLPLPLSLRQGVELDSPSDLTHLYSAISSALVCPVPQRNFAMLAHSLQEVAARRLVRPVIQEQLDRDRAIRTRLEAALANPRHKWRTLSRLASEVALSEEEVADILRSDATIRFSRSRLHRTIVALRSRVD